MISVSSVTQLCPTLYDPMNRSTPGLPVHHQLLEFTRFQTHGILAIKCWMSKIPPRELGINTNAIRCLSK